MPLNTSGPISLAGATTGESIAVELGLSASGNISLNQADVRALAGVPSGAITMPTNFYGKSAGSGYTVGVIVASSTYCATNRVTRLNACGALIGNNTFTTQALRLAASGTSCNVGVYYQCGYSGGTSVARVNSSGALVGSITNAGTARGGQAGARTGANLLVWGGAVIVSCGCCTYESPVCTVTRINGSGNLVGSEGSVAFGGYASVFTGWAAASSTSTNSLFYSGGNLMQRINACGAKVGSNTNAGTNITRAFNAAAQIGANACRNGGVAVFYAGLACGFLARNCVTRVNACGALVGSVTNVGTARYKLTGVTIGSVGVFYGGCPGCKRSTRINVCGALVGSEVSPVGIYGFFDTGGSASYT